MHKVTQKRKTEVTVSQSPGQFLSPISRCL